MRKKCILLAGTMLTLALTVVCVQPLKATSIEDERNKQQELKEEIADAQKILKELEQLKNDTTVYLSALDEKINELTTYIISLNTQITAKEADIEEINGQLAAQQEDIELQYASMKKRIKFLYENGQTEYLDMILNSGSISDMLNKAEYLTKITEYDRNMLDKLKETKEQIEETKQDLITEKEALNELKEEAQRQQGETEVLANEKGKVLQETNTKISDTQSSVETMEGQLAASEAIEAELVELERKREEQRRLEEQKRLEEEKRQEELRKEEEKKKEEERRLAEEKKRQEQTDNNSSDDTDDDRDNQNDDDDKKTDTHNSDSDRDDSSSQGGSDTSSGQFLWPLPGYSYISSGFIHRINPVTGKAENHSGIDIPAPAGTPIIAAAGGTVAWAYRSASAGNWVGVEHDNGLYTVYMHMSGFNCQEGDRVKAGDVIGFVGTTGQSTGNHLHFSVRLDGAYVNPLAYLP